MGLRICVLKESLCIGGTERSAANISRALAQTHDVTFAVYDGSKTVYPYGGELVDFRLPPRGNVFAKALNNVLRKNKCSKLVKERKIDVLYQFTVISNPLTCWKEKNCKKVISARDFSVMKKKHGEYRKALKNSDGMVCNSNYLREFYLSKYPEDEGKVFTVYNIIDRDEIALQAKESVEPEFEVFLEKHPQTVVSVGRFCKEKGFEYLIESLAKARETEEGLGLVLVGDGTYLDRYEEVIRRFGLEDHIYMTGFQKNPYKYMARCSCFVLSSLSEGFPNVLAEAMALGHPVIATNCYSGPAEILRGDGDYAGVTDRYQLCDYGVITPRFGEEHHENAVFQMAKAILDLLSDETLKEKYSALAEERAAHFSPEAALDKINGIFAFLIR